MAVASVLEANLEVRSGGGHVRLGAVKTYSATVNTTTAPAATAATAATAAVGAQAGSLEVTWMGDHDELIW